MINYNPLGLYFSYIWDELPLYRKLFLNLQFIRIFFVKWDIPKNINTQLLFTQSLNRNDYNSFVKYIYNAAECNQKQYILISQKYKFNFDCFELNLNDIVEIWKDIIADNIFMKLFIVLNIIQVASIRKNIKTYNIDVLTTHADMRPIENYLIQYFKSKNKKTVTLQHGLYIDYSKSKNINEVNYKNVVSEFFLSWGNETKELINKYHPHCNVVLCGNPTIKTNRLEKNKKFFGIVFDQELLKHYNKEILQIGQQLAKDLNMKIILRLHPRNNINDYIIDKNLIVDENIEEAMFVIGHTTTMLYTLMKSGMPVFKYKTQIPSNNIEDRFLFSTGKEIRKKILDIKSTNYMIKGNYYLEYINDDSLLSYKTFYKELINEKY